VSGVLPYVPAALRAETEAAPTGRVPATLRDIPPGLRSAVGAVVHGVVVGLDRQGHLLVRTAQGQLVLATPLRPPIDSAITLQVRSLGATIQAEVLKVVPPPAATAAGTSAGPSTAGGHAEGTAALTRVWPALEEALDALARQPVAGAAAGAGASSLNGTVPQPGPAFASGLLFLMAALGRGDLGGWLGQTNLDALRRIGREDLTGRLEQDFGQLARLARGADGDEGRLFVLPVLIEGVIRPLRFFLQAPDRQPDDESPRRFLVEAELPMLGELQLDGLTQPGRLDLILRSRTPLPESLQHELRALLAQTAAAGAFAGDLAFTAGPHWRFRQGPAKPDPPHGLVV